MQIREIPVFGIVMFWCAACDAPTPTILSCAHAQPGDLAVVAYRNTATTTALHVTNLTLFPIRFDLYLQAPAIQKRNATLALPSSRSDWVVLQRTDAGTATFPVTATIRCDSTRLDTFVIEPNNGTWQLTGAHRNARTNDIRDRWQAPTQRQHQERHPPKQPDTTPEMSAPEPDPPAAPAPCSDAFPDAASPTTGSLLLTEVMANPDNIADRSGEWLELAATADIDLNDLRIELDGEVERLQAPAGTCPRLIRGTFLLLHRDRDRFRATTTARIWTLPTALPNRHEPQHLVIRSRSGIALTAVTFVAAPAGQSWQLDRYARDSGYHRTCAQSPTPGAPNARCPQTLRDAFAARQRQRQ